MKTQFLILLGMIWMHIFDDFVLQPICLSKLKQKDFWEETFKDNPKYLHHYRNDYKMALFIHALSWTISIFIIPLLFYCNKIFNDINGMILVSSLILMNMYIHYRIDDMKANKKYITLIFDQIVHLLQIILLWVILCCLEV